MNGTLKDLSLLEGKSSSDICKEFFLEMTSELMLSSLEAAAKNLANAFAISLGRISRPVSECMQEIVQHVLVFSSERIFFQISLTGVEMVIVDVNFLRDSLLANFKVH